MKLTEKWKALLAREKEKMKDMTPKKKVEYLVGNWWVEFCIVCLVVASVVACTYMLVSSTRDRVLYLVAVDAEMSKNERNAIVEEIKDYSGHTKWKETVLIDSNVSSLGALDMETSMDAEAMNHQQKSMILIGTGQVDAYVCPQVYVEFLRDYDDLETVENIIGADLAQRYGDRISLDGYALRLGAEAGEMLCADYEPLYLVFTYNNHYPDVTRAFAQMLLEKD